VWVLWYRQQLTIGNDGKQWKNVSYSTLIRSSLYYSPCFRYHTRHRWVNLRELVPKNIEVFGWGGKGLYSCTTHLSPHHFGQFLLRYTKLAWIYTRDVSVAWYSHAWRCIYIPCATDVRIFVASEYLLFGNAEDSASTSTQQNKQTNKTKWWVQYILIVCRFYQNIFDMIVALFVFVLFSSSSHREDTLLLLLLHLFFVCIHTACSHCSTLLLSVSFVLIRLKLGIILIRTALLRLVCTFSTILLSWIVLSWLIHCFLLN
jgi:hypothetical protein